MSKDDHVFHLTGNTPDVERTKTLSYLRANAYANKMNMCIESDPHPENNHKKLKVMS